jgi:hypothetical protein
MIKVTHKTVVFFLSFFECSSQSFNQSLCSSVKLTVPVLSVNQRFVFVISLSKISIHTWLWLKPEIGMATTLTVSPIVAVAPLPATTTAPAEIRSSLPSSLVTRLLPLVPRAPSLASKVKVPVIPDTSKLYAPWQRRSTHLFAVGLPHSK